MKNILANTALVLAFFACGVSPSQATPTSKDLKCLADNVYFEARGENEMGKVAVAVVTINRVNSKHYPNTICEVVWQPSQFSWTRDGRSDIIVDVKSYSEILDLVNKLLYTNMYDEMDTLDNVTHYHNNTVNPKWNKTLHRSFVIGKHTFYRF